MFCSRLKRALATLAVGALVFAPNASASPAPEVEIDYTMALAYWAVPAPSQCSTVAFATSATPADPAVYDDPVGTEVLATATLPTSLHEACIVTTYPAWEPLGPCMRRMVMRHEVGHLLGHGHSADPGNIMYAQISEALWCPEEYELRRAQEEAVVAARQNAEAEALAAVYRAEAAAREAALTRLEHREARCRRTHGKRAKAACWRALRRHYAHT